MLPGVDLRIENMLKALEQVVIPALPNDQRLAKDQANLIAGHLRMIKGQWKFAVKFEAASLANLIELGAHLLPLADSSYLPVLGAALANARAIDATDQDDLSGAIRLLGGAIDKIILGDDGRIPLSADASAAILCYGRIQARRERSWFAATGLDPDRDELPSIAQTMHDDSIPAIGDLAENSRLLDQNSAPSSVGPKSA